MSVRKSFTKLLFDLMANDTSVVLLLGDLGWKQFDLHREAYPSRCVNVGASEQLMIGMAAGLCSGGLIPIVYTMTPFAIYRPFEFIRTFMERDQFPVKICSAGRGYDYDWLGWTHWAHDDAAHMSGFQNIACYWPETGDELETMLEDVIYSDKPTYLNLSR